jgi:hypothetical protein
MLRNMLSYFNLRTKGTTCLLLHRCEPFPTYPRTYDMLHANGLLSHLSSERCAMMDLFLEMDRILRPEVLLTLLLVFLKPIPWDFLQWPIRLFTFWF